jgi:N-methylhydantoinase B
MGEHELGVVLFGKGTRAPMSLGLFGGYPGSTVGYETFRSAELERAPRSLEELRAAERRAQSWGAVELAEGDVQYVRFMGGGGYGDPIDRDPALVVRDVQLGLVTAGPAREIYGVVIADGQVDVSATEARRREIRRERLGREPERGHGEVAPGRRVSEYLQRSEAGGVQCTVCGYELVTGARGDGTAWKDAAAVRRRPLAVAGPYRADTGDFFLLEACCPGCGTLLDADLAHGDDPPLHDRIEAWA